MNKTVYLGFSILDVIKTLMQEFWYDYIQPKYENNAKLCYMDTGGFIIQIKTEDFFKDIADDVVKWFDTSNYSEDDKRQLPRGMNKIGRNWSNFVIGPFKDELGGKIMTEFVALRPQTYS